MSKRTGHNARITATAITDEGGATAFVLDTKPGDVVVIHSDRDLTQETAEALRDAFARRLPADVPVVVIGPDIRIEVNHRVEIARREQTLRDQLRREDDLIALVESLPRCAVCEMLLGEDVHKGFDGELCHQRCCSMCGDHITHDGPPPPPPPPPPNEGEEVARGRLLGGYALRKWRNR